MKSKKKHCFPFGGRPARASALMAVVACCAASSHASWAQDTLVLTQIPREPQGGAPKSSVDAWYPAGTRVVATKAPFAPDHAMVLSAGLVAAGSPVVSYDGRRVVFAGKKTTASDWQIYETPLRGGHPRPLTDVPGGAAHPALLANGSVVFVAAPTTPGAAVSRAKQLHLQAPGEKPRQLTFAPSGANDPTMLLDGRILFVAAQPAENNGAGSTAKGTALYTVNNDGTELTAFACQHDSPVLIYSPRQLNDGRVAFLAAEDLRAASISASEQNQGCAGFEAETVRMARPFASRANLLQKSGKSQPANMPGWRVRSVQPCGTSNLLVCASGTITNGRFCCYRVSCDARAPGAPLFEQASYDTIEAIEAAPSTPPMGRLSTMDATKKTGQILCLDINDTISGTADHPAPKAVRVRLMAGTVAGAPRVLGEVDVQPDGSFMAEVPADLPLGFEALDEHGQVVRSEAPNLWVRSGENRACVGCHAAHNRAPHNHRPLAVRVPVANFCSLPQTNVVTQARK